MILNYIKTWDYFGYPAVMHFGRNPAKDQDGDTIVNTLIGAIYSIGLRLIYILAVYFYMSRMVLAQDNKLSTVDINANWEALSIA